MDRIIKFRGKYLDDTSEWLYGNYVFLEKDIFQHKIADKFGILLDIDINTVGQYTGLKDKNGKEIYEGDIVKVKLYIGEEEKYYIGKVEYCGSTFIVDVNNNSEYHVYDLDGFGVDSENNLEDCEVIGNVWDNPELLNYFEEEEEWEE